jgi:hypothetical protein
MTTIFIEKFDSDECQDGGVHDFNEVILTYRTRDGEERYIFKKHYDKTKKKDRMKIVGGQLRCTKCKIPYTHAHNPMFIED